jgi:2'-hydroxyisoflavone reductase
MKVLILGGTQFVGLHMTQVALNRGHEVTLFNRGKTNPHIFPNVERLIGDRKADISALENRTWDAVLDVNGYHPNDMIPVLNALKGKVGHYAFISTVSVHPESNENDDETAPVAPEPDPSESVTGETYGGFKVTCERMVQEIFPTALIVRPGLVIGANDHTDRFNYWVIRAAQGGDMLLPPQNSPLQVVDGRDLASFTISQIERNASGIYQVTGLPATITIEQVFNIAKRVTDGETTPHYMTDEFLLDAGVQVFADLPLWLSTDMHGFYKRNVSKALDAGLTYHSLEDSIEDIWNWWQAQRSGSALKAGMNREREAEILAKANATN